MAIVVRAFPFKGTTADMNAFTGELTGSRKEDATRFYREFGVKHESWHLQETPSGPWVIVVSMLDENPKEAGQRYAVSNADFHSWFKSNVMRLTGVDANTDPLGPPTKSIFHWTDTVPPRVPLV